MNRGALMVGGLAAVAGVALLVRQSKADTPVLPPPAPGGSPPPAPSGGSPGGSSGMTLAEKAFCMRQHAYYFSWLEADRRCRELDASNPANIDAVLSSCGGALSAWQTMMSDCGVRAGTNEEEAVYNLLVGG